MFRAMTHPSDRAGADPALAEGAKTTARMILSRTVPDASSKPHKAKWQKAKWWVLKNLMAASNRHIGALDLPHLIMSDMTLPRRLNLTGANLRKSEFNRVTMTAVLLCQSDLSHANLTSCNMRRAKLRHATLYRARLDKVLLRRADLQHADLNQAQLNHAVLDFAKLHNANFKLTSFYRAKLRHVDLSDAYLRYANLRNADLRTTHFRGTCLRNANLSGAHISPGGMCNMNFQGAIIEGDLKLDLSAGWSQKNALDNYLNPSNYAKGGGVLQAIDSISTVYQPLKITLMRQIMVSLQQTDLSLATVAPALLDKLSSAPYYDEPDIARWSQEIGSRFISIFDTKIMRRQQEEVLRVILDTFSRYPESMVIHSAAFIQTIAQAIYARRASATVQQAKTLYARYLTHRRIAPYALKEKFGDRAKHAPNWQDKSAANYVFLPANAPPTPCCYRSRGLKAYLVAIIALRTAGIITFTAMASP